MPRVKLSDKRKKQLNRLATQIWLECYDCGQWDDSMVYASTQHEKQRQAKELGLTVTEFSYFQSRFNERYFN